MMQVAYSVLRKLKRMTAEETPPACSKRMARASELSLMPVVNISQLVEVVELKIFSKPILLLEGYRNTAVRKACAYGL